MKLSFQELCEVKEAQELYSHCSNKIIYNDPILLKSLYSNVRFFKILNGKETIFLFNFVNNSLNLPHIYYFSLLEVNWKTDQNNSNYIDNFISVIKFIFDEVLFAEKCFDICFSTNITDIRGVLWSDLFNKGHGLSIRTKYTHLINITETNTAKALELNFRSSRRQEMRYAIDREKLSVSQTPNIQILKDLYIYTLNKQRIQPNAREVTAIQKIYQHLEKVLPKENYKIIAVKTVSNSYVAAALVFKDFDGVIHVPVVGMGQTKYGGSLLYQAIIAWACDIKGKLIDFNGANSPKRAYFKHSLGGYSKHFFQISYQVPEY